MEKNLAPAPGVLAMVDKIVLNAKQAERDFLQYSQAEIDHIVKAMALAGVDKHMELARLAVEDTKMGVYEDKVTKNLFATEYVYHSIKYEKTVGLINTEEEGGFAEVAEPVGVIAGITPVTNPTSTTMFKSLIAVKTRNPIVFAFHPKAQKSSAEAARVMYQAAIKAGAPENCITWIPEPSVEATRYLMRHPAISLVLATGGAAMVEAAYSSGRPALGVGPGNVPAYIEKTANLRRAVADIIVSKTFDNGVICASEQAVIVDQEIYQQVKDLFRQLGGYFLNPVETKVLEELVIDREQKMINPRVVGQRATVIAKMAGIHVPDNTQLLIAEVEGVGEDYPLTREKLSPIIAFLKARDTEHGICLSEQMTEFGGLGHSAVIHSEDQEVIRQFAKRVQAGRLIVNSPSVHGAIGEIYNRMTPSLTLGCGSMGGNSTTDNISVRHLINIKRVSQRKVRMKWFRVPERIYFEAGSIQYLSKLYNHKRAVIVTDKTMVQLGLVEKVMRQLEKINIDAKVFLDVEPDPSVETVKKGARMMADFGPDLIIALGGGSPMDAAKGMWLFYEYPETNFEDLRLKFADIRKRTYKYPKLGLKATMVAIPTTSGTGSEVTAFAVITDKERGIKYPLADYELTPDIAILDPDLVKTMPPSLTADTGFDALVHAVEAYVSVLASDFTDAMALKATELIFQWLPVVYKEPDHMQAREKMHNAATMAGMAFTNAFLGINHSLAHVLGAKFHLSHGRANAILMPYVIKYNASMPTKLIAYPKYEFPEADRRYMELARYLGLPAGSVAEGVESLIQAVINLRKELNLPATLEEAGIKAEELEGVVKEMAYKAFADQTTTSNPRMPLVEELEMIYRLAYNTPLDHPALTGTPPREGNDIVAKRDASNSN
jgi:acetaldehyde dehydrogenase/alcohol dehydrogenase